MPIFPFPLVQFPVTTPLHPWFNVQHLSMMMFLDNAGAGFSIGLFSLSLCHFKLGSVFNIQVKTLRDVSGHVHMVLNVFLACRVPWVSPMATGVTINH